MATPIHCGKATKIYRKVYQQAFYYRDKNGNRKFSPCSYEVGFQCVVCKQIRIPDI